MRSFAVAVAAVIAAGGALACGGRGANAPAAGPTDVLVAPDAKRAPPDAKPAPVPALPPASAPASAARGVARVTFDGNHDLTREELDAVVFVDKGPPEGDTTEQDLFDRDVLYLTAAYYDHGYIDARVDGKNAGKARDGATDFRVAIHEGPRYRIGTLAIDEVDANGRPVTPVGGTRLRDRIALKDGAWFNRASLVEDLGRIRTLYRDAGYASVEADPQLTTTPQIASADIVVPVRRGPLVTIESVRVLGNKSVPTAAIERAVRVRAGELFGETKLQEAKSRVLALGGLERVDVSTQEGASASRIIVSFEVTER